MKIALVHDYLVQHGGAEKVLECFCEVFPDAPIYTLVYDRKIMNDFLADRKIYTSFLQKIPLAKTRHRLFPPIMPMAIEQFDFSEYDVVLSDSSSFAKGIITGPDTLHICYMHTPMRYAWDDCQKYVQEFGFPKIIKKIVPLFMNYIRVWDRASADRPDIIIAISNFIKKRIKKYYGREASVLHPPVSIDRFSVSETKADYFLMVGRLMTYKRFDIAIQAFNKSGLPLKIIGRGPEMERLKKMSASNIEFLGRVSDEELLEHFSKSRGFIFPQEEDFGIVAIEALAAGCPLVAFRGGDIVEHMEEGRMGVFFDQQTPDSLTEAINKFNQLSFDYQYIRSQVLQFDRELFKKKIRQFVEDTYSDFKTK